MRLPYDAKQPFKKNIANLHEHFTDKAASCKASGDECETNANAEERLSYKNLHMAGALGFRGRKPK